MGSHPATIKTGVKAFPRGQRGTIKDLLAGVADLDARVQRLEANVAILAQEAGLADVLELGSDDPEDITEEDIADDD